MTDERRRIDNLDELGRAIRYRLGVGMARRMFVEVNGPDVPIPDDLEPFFIEELDDQDDL